MNSEQVREICNERLSRWADRLVSEHATPIILIGVSHDHKSGQLVLCTTEEMSNADIRALLRNGMLRIK
jgi:hypothetical protein